MWSPFGLEDLKQANIEKKTISTQTRFLLRTINDSTLICFIPKNLKGREITFRMGTIRMLVIIGGHAWQLLNH